MLWAILGFKRTFAESINKNKIAKTKASLIDFVAFLGKKTTLLSLRLKLIVLNCSETEQFCIRMNITEKSLCIMWTVYYKCVLEGLTEDDSISGKKIQYIFKKYIFSIEMNDQTSTTTTTTAAAWQITFFWIKQPYRCCHYSNHQLEITNNASRFTTRIIRIYEILAFRHMQCVWRIPDMK